MNAIVRGGQPRRLPPPRGLIGSDLPRARARRRPNISRPALRVAHTSSATTATRQTSGNAIASIDNPVALTVSTVLTTGFPSPPVARPVFARTTAALPLVRPAMPPPAMIATGHITAGGTSDITAALAITPAASVAGLASTSSAWSTPGM